MSLSGMMNLCMEALLENFSEQLDIVVYTLTLQISREDSAAVQERDWLTKLESDYKYIKQQVFELYSELEEKQAFTSLLQVVEEREQKKAAEKMRREGKRELEQTMNTLQRLQNDLEQKTDKLEDLCRHREGLKHQLNEQSLKAADWSKIVDKGSELELRMIKEKIGFAERVIEEQLDTQQEVMYTKLEEEVDVHKALLEHLELQKEGLREQLKQFQQKSKLMQLEKQERLNGLVRRTTVDLDKLSEMRRMFREMEEVVLQDRQEQEKLRQQRAEIEAVTKMQAWWRGCMVRRGLGIYKKDKGKKGKKGKKKDQKGKKKK